MPVRTASHNLNSAGQPTNGWEHRSRASGWVTNPVAVSRKVNAKELARNPKAREKMRDEYSKLTDDGVWDLSGVRGWRDVAAEAKKAGTKAHRGNVFGLCFEKGAELPEGHPDRKFKGRYVFQGNIVRDEFHEAALFNELGSSPATLEGAKAVDGYGCLPGHCTESADAKQAYTQALLGKSTPGSSTGPGGGVPCQVHTTTWVTLPPEVRPKTKDGRDLWRSQGIVDPVVPLIKALYGHPDAGGYWERHCNAHLAKCGFKPIENWPSMFWNDELSLMLMVYVDDFKMSGPKSSLAEGWKRIKRGLDIDDPVPVDRCLGCRHKQLKGEVNGKPVNVMQYVVEDFMEQCVQAYKDACQEPDMKLRPVETPFTASPDGGVMDLIRSQTAKSRGFYNPSRLLYL